MSNLKVSSLPKIMLRAPLAPFLVLLLSSRVGVFSNTLNATPLLGTKSTWSPLFDARKTACRARGILGPLMIGRGDCFEIPEFDREGSRAKRAKSTDGLGL